MVAEYSIWLMPSGEVREELASIITRLSTEYDAPLFPPHVTLIGRLSNSEQDLIAKAQQLAASLKPYELRLGMVDYTEEFHRSLFVHIEETEAVMEANRIARQVFDCHNDPKYMPHMSLLYGHFTPALKESIITKIGKRFTQTFQATSIHLYSTLGETKDWYALREFAVGVEARG